MIFNETKKHRELYASILQIKPNSENINSVTTRNKQNAKKASRKWFITYLAFLISEFLVYELWCWLNKEIPNEKGILIIILNPFFICWLIMAYGMICAAHYYKIMNDAQITPFKQIQKLSDFKNKKDWLQLIDPKLINDNYFLLTYASDTDKQQHANDIAKLIHDNPTKHVVVYILPDRVPYMTRIDKYVFCYAMQDKHLILLGIMPDNSNHTALAELAQTHKLGPMLPNETITRHCEILS